MKPKICSLFAGIGGFDLGFERAGFETAVQVDLSDDCRSVLARHFPGALRVSDILALPSIHRRIRRGKPVPNYDYWKSLLDLLARCLVFTGGFPCQDLSVAGARAGLAGERSGLWYVFRRLLALFRPAWVVIENVPGLLSSNRGGDFATVLRGLATIGYQWTYRVLDSQYFELAQRRERVFIVGCLGESRRLGPGDRQKAVGEHRGIQRLHAEVLFEPGSVCGDSAPSRETREGAAPTLTSGSGGGRYDKQLHTIAGALGSNPAGGHRQDLDGAGAYIVSEPAIPHGSGDGAVSSKWAKGSGGPAGDAAPITGRPYDDRGDDVTKLVPAMAFKPSHYTRDKDGAPSEIYPPLSADADKGDQEAVIAFPQNLSGTQCASAEGIAPVLQSDNPTAVAFNVQSQNSNSMLGDGRARAACETDVARCLDSAGFTAQQGGTVIFERSARYGVRRLTPRECERLQGFPEDWTRYRDDGSELSDSARYRMTGNAVSVPPAEWIARRLLAAILKSQVPTPDAS